ncbi:MAG: 50S ribosomal protein L23 [Anaerolineaceae bacterium]|nr:50S ribosomal protein L23 [Anaerolineaceae bacterium]
MKSPYDILIRPLVTEKSAYQSSKLSQYAFEVPKSATRADVRNAIEEAFDVKVLKVNTINVAPKMGRKGNSRRKAIKRSAYKKAIVKIRPEDRIPIFEGVE